jgi:uncharacterized protein (DUF58 family)
MRWWWGAVVLLTLGLVFRLGLLVYAMYVLLGVLALSWYWTRRWTEDLEVERVCPIAEAEIGDNVEITVSVRNPRRQRVPWLLMEEALPLDALRQSPPRLRATGPRVAVAAMGPREERTFRYRLEFLMRGYFQIGPLLLESGDLFGLHRRYRVATVPRFVLVRPRTIALEGYDLASRRPIGEVRIQHRLFEDPTRISGVRPYERGDPLNRIHWRATARTGVLHSKSYDPSCVAGATLLLDFHRDGYVARKRPALTPELARLMASDRASRGEHEIATETQLVELAVTTAASLANAVYELGQQVGLVSNGRDAADRIRLEGWQQNFRTRSVARATLFKRERNERLQPVVVETRRGTGQLSQILDLLARLELTDGFEFPDLVWEAGSRLPRDATVAAILTRVSEGTAIALGDLRRRGFAVTAVVVGSEEVEYHDWSSPPDWAARLLAEGVPFRRVEDEAGLSRLCAEALVR